MTRARRGLLVLVAVALLASATARADALETVDVARPSDGGVVGSDAVPRTKQTIAADADADPTREEWRYRTNEELAAALRALHEGACAGISALSSTGRSVRGVDLPVLEIAVPEEKANSKTGAGGDNGGAKPSFGFIANMHGDEPVGRELALRLARLLCDAHRGVGGGGGDGDDAATLTAAAALVASARLFFVPTMNPDGFATRSRNNANGVDLNRDFPDQFRGGLKLERGDFGGGGDDDDAAGRQPETAAMMRWSRATNLTAALNFHEGALVANYPWDGTDDGKTRYSRAPDDPAFRRMASAYASAHRGRMIPATAELSIARKSRRPNEERFKGGITNGAAWYPLWGGMQDWHYIVTGTMALTIEVNEVKWPEVRELERLWREHAPAMLATALVACAKSVSGVVVDAVTRAPISGPGVVLTIEPRGEGGAEGAAMPFSTLNGTGQYARPCAAGKVRVRASAPGYEPAVGEGEASDEKGAVVSLALMPRARGEAAAAVAAAAARGDRIGTDPISAAVGVARDDVEEELGLGGGGGGGARRSAFASARGAVVFFLSHATAAMCVMCLGCAGLALRRRRARLAQRRARIVGEFAADSRV